MAEKLLAVKGMNDILPPESARWEWLEDKVRALMARYAYRNIRTPILEHTQLFVRGIGEVTDIVEKEMYSFTDRLNGEELTLRPENTAGVVRASVEHSMLYEGGKRLYYMGPMFRHERPQRGRYREFLQCDVDIIGESNYLNEVECIKVYDTVFNRLSMPKVNLRINNRQILEGISQLMNLDSVNEIASVLDKTDKIGVDGVINELKKKNNSEKL